MRKKGSGAACTDHSFVGSEQVLPNPARKQRTQCEESGLADVMMMEKYVGKDMPCMSPPHPRAAVDGGRPSQTCVGYWKQRSG
jgi:hypothetical protein